MWALLLKDENLNRIIKKKLEINILYKLRVGFEPGENKGHEKKYES